MYKNKNYKNTEDKNHTSENTNQSSQNLNTQEKTNNFSRNRFNKNFSSNNNKKNYTNNNQNFNQNFQSHNQRKIFHNWKTVDSNVDGMGRDMGEKPPFSSTPDNPIAQFAKQTIIPNKDYKVPTQVFSLGGLEMVGENCYCIEHADELIVVDAGMRLPSADILGIDAIIPSYHYLKSKEKNIAALIITHGHEDHIGAIKYLLHEVNIPIIYGPKLANLLMKRKMAEAKCPNIKIKEFDTNFVIKTKHFEISFFEQTHSIPDAYGVCFKTVNGTIVSTGDFKFDLTPIRGRSEVEKMASLGNKGVDLLLSDSTNALVPGITPSEKSVIFELEKILKKTNGRIILSTFASNVFRIQQIVNIAAKLNKKIVLLGRSMERIVEASLKIGYIDCPASTFISPRQIKEYPAKDILIICTGSQGEPLAALSKMANNNHKDVTVEPTDTIILSSNPIPGNFLSVEHLTNKLAKLGATVLENSPTSLLHTSGHAAQDEQKIMLNLIRPKYFMPIHGTHAMLKAHANTGISCGVKPENVLIVNNGQKVYLIDGVVSYGPKFNQEEIFVNGTDSKAMNGVIVKDRQNLYQNGVIAVTLFIDPLKNKILQEPILKVNGFALDEKGNENELLCKKTVIDSINKLYATRKVTFADVKECARDAVSQFVNIKKHRNPVVIPLIIREQANVN